MYLGAGISSDDQNFQLKMASIPALLVALLSDAFSRLVHLLSLRSLLSFIAGLGSSLRTVVVTLPLYSLSIMTAAFMMARRNPSTASSSPRASTSLTDRSTTAPSTTATSISDSFPAHEKDVVLDFPESESLPTEAVLEQVADAMLVAADGSTRTFRSLYTDDVRDVDRHQQEEEKVDGAVKLDDDIVGRKNIRTLLIFIRHFLCGVCSGFSSSIDSCSSEMVIIIIIMKNRVAKITSALLPTSILIHPHFLPCLFLPGSSSSDVVLRI